MTEVTKGQRLNWTNSQINSGLIAQRVHWKYLLAFESRPVTEMSLDAQHFIPFDQAFAAGERSHIDLAGVSSNREITDEGVLGFSQAGGHNSSIQLFGANNWLAIRSARSANKTR